MYSIIFRKDAPKQLKNLKAIKLLDKVNIILDAMEKDPFVTPPPFKVLHGDKAGIYSRRINLQHRIFYTVDDTSKAIYILSMWNHDLER